MHVITSLDAVPAGVTPEVALTLRDWLRDRQAQMVERLRALVEAESPSGDPDSQAAVLALLAAPLEALGYAVQRLPGRRSGGQLYARPAQRERGRAGQLLLGHADTVWPRGTLAHMPFRLVDGHAHGPGAFDMKGGLVQMVAALEAIAALGLVPPATPLVFVSTDEEIGSGDSRGAIVRLARASARAFVLEPALGLEGRLKTARKGVGRFTIVVHGRAAHAGLAPGSGASAIVELSHLVQALHALNDPATGVTVNVGNIEGGQAANVVAPRAQAEVDVRVPTAEDADRVESAIRGLLPTTPGVALEISGRVGREPLSRTPRNRRLWQQAQHAASLLGLPLAEGTAGGGSDGSLTSRYTATLDGLGAVGDGAHAAHEFVVVERMPERAALLALLLLAPVEPASVASNDVMP